MPKNMILTCSQKLWFWVELEVPDGVDVEDYVYSFRLNCLELGENGDWRYRQRMGEWDNVVVEDITEEEE